MANGVGFLGRKDLIAFGYREVKQGGISWLANEQGLRFISGVDNWSPQRLTLEKGWRFWDDGSHALYVGQNSEGLRFLVKAYHRENGSGGFFNRRTNKAKREFHNTLLAYKKGFRTIPPLALGEGNQDQSLGIIVYPFLENAIPLDRAYAYKEPGELTVSERQHLEKGVGRLLRMCMDSGLFPENMCLGHFLAKREPRGGLVVYWVDFEKVKFRPFFRQRYIIRNLGKLLARIEWFRMSGGKINRSSVMRIGHACFCEPGSRKLNKSLCHAIIQAAKEYWDYRKIDARGLYSYNLIQADDRIPP